jgi:hypothetical protein
MRHIIHMHLFQPLWMIFLCLLHIVLKNFAPRAVTTYVSAFGYFHGLRQMPDVSVHFLVNNSLTGYRNLLKRPDFRSPITRIILWSLIQSLPHITLCHFTRTLFKAMLLVMFACFLRLGEVTATSSHAHFHRSHVSFKYRNPIGELIGFDLTIKITNISLFLHNMILILSQYMLWGHILTCAKHPMVRSLHLWMIPLFLVPIMTAIFA